MPKTFVTPEGTFSVEGCWATLVNIRKNIPVGKPDGTTAYQAVAVIFFDLTLPGKVFWQGKHREVVLLETPGMHTDAQVEAVAWGKIRGAILQAKADWAGYIL